MRIIKKDNMNYSFLYQIFIEAYFCARPYLSVEDVPLNEMHESTYKQTNNQVVTNTVETRCHSECRDTLDWGLS